MADNTRLEKIQRMLTDEPGDPELHYMLAMEYSSQGDDVRAVEIFDKLFALTPNYLPAYHMAGRLLQRLNRIPEARAVLKKGMPIALAQGNSHAAEEMQALLETLE